MSFSSLWTMRQWWAKMDVHYSMTQPFASLQGWIFRHNSFQCFFDVLRPVHKRLPAWPSLQSRELGDSIAFLLGWAVDTINLKTHWIDEVTNHSTIELRKCFSIFYTSNHASSETLSRRESIRPPPSRTVAQLRFLHTNISERFKYFKMHFSNVEIARSKLYSLRPLWIRERTPHETHPYIYHANADLLLGGNYVNITFAVPMISIVGCSLRSELRHYYWCNICFHLTASDIICDGFDIDIQDPAV